MNVTNKRKKWKKILIATRPVLESEIEFILSGIELQDRGAIKELKECIIATRDAHCRYGENTPETEMRFKDILKDINRIFGTLNSGGTKK